jgi:hypothetical protein
MPQHQFQPSIKETSIVTCLNINPCRVSEKPILSSASTSIPAEYQRNRYCHVPQHQSLQCQRNRYCHVPQHQSLQNVRETGIVTCLNIYQGNRYCPVRQQQSPPSVRQQSLPSVRETDIVTCLNINPCRVSEKPVLCRASTSIPAEYQRDQYCHVPQHQSLQSIYESESVFLINDSAMLGTTKNQRYFDK